MEVRSGGGTTKKSKRNKKKMHKERAGLKEVIRKKARTCKK